MATSNWAKAIIHLDMDAFYAAVEVMDNPDLQGKPVIVGGSKERGVVSSASYEARTFGIHSAQPVATAIKLCPQGIFRPVRMWRYKEISRQIFEIFQRFSPLVEPLSLDEAFVDVTGSTRLFGPPEEIAKKIKQQVVAETGLTASAGVAPTKFIAKIASDIQKPDGLTIVPEGKVKEFLGPLPIEKLWGVGEKTRKTLAHLVGSWENMDCIFLSLPREWMRGRWKQSARLSPLATRKPIGRISWTRQWQEKYSFRSPPG
jgi:DNA polymerase-4